MDKTAKMWMSVAIFLFFVILIMLFLLFAIPTPKSEPLVATTTPQTPVAETPKPAEPAADQPLSARVSVTTPKPKTTVGASFEVKGMAPGNWFFEATFPLQVRDKDGNVVARTFASAQGEWMTTELVGFSSTIHVDTGYTGPATLILLKNNPSGMPEHDDALEIPIVIQ